MLDTCLAALLFAAFTESYIVYQIIIYAPFYISNETHALDSKINLFVALTLSAYPFGLVIGHRLRNRMQKKYNSKTSLLINFVFNMIGLIIMSDSTIFDRSIYHFVIGNFIMGLFGNSWINILSIAYLLENNYKYNKLYCYISSAHGFGTIFAALIGAFFNINNGEQINFMDTPFIIAISFCALTICFIHYKLDVNNDGFENDIDDIPANPMYKNILFWYSQYDDYDNAIGTAKNLFYMLFIIFVLLLSVIFSFDILFPTYASISASNGGMGWNSHYIGIFYMFYTFSWIFIILYRYWKLNNGYAVTTSFTNSSLKILKFNCLVLILIYGIIFPFCINSQAIHHAQWSPISWVLLGIVLAILYGIISASTSYHIIQSFYDLILNQINSNNNNNDNIIHNLFIILSNTLIYMRIILPIMFQFIFVISIHLNHTMISKHFHSTREWYQIGNLVFYVLAILSLIAFILLIIYDNLRREKFTEQIDTQEMTRLITELRQEQQNQNTNIIEDFHGLGFWLSINSKSIIPQNISHALCFEKYCKMNE